MAAGNIFWDIHNAIWDLLEAKAAFTDQIKAGNRIKFTGADREPPKQFASNADFPQVMVWNAGITAIDRAASNATTITVQWEVLVHSGEQPCDPFFDVQWAVFVALINWDDTMTAIEWDGGNPVRNCDILKARDTLLGSRHATQGPPFHQNIRGWGSVWVGKSDCWFSHSALQVVL